MYSTWQPFGQALLVDSPLLFYIDVWHANLLPLKFTIGEARDIGWRYTCLDELAPIRDETAELVSRILRERAHKAIQREAIPAEPRDFGWRYTCSDELAPIRDEIAELVSPFLRERAHKVVQHEAVLAELEAPVQEAEHAAVESSDSSKTHSIRGEEMVTCRTLIVSRFIPDACQIAQQQPPQGRGQTPLAHPPPPPPFA